MKKNKWFTFLALCCGMCIMSCSQMGDDVAPADKSKQGTLSLKISATKQFEATRAVSEDSYKDVNNYNVTVTNTTGTSVLSCLGSELASKMPLNLPIGTYTVNASYGTMSPASRDGFYVEGIRSFTIAAGKETSANVDCAPTCGRVKVNFAPEMATYFNEYHVTFTGTQALGSESRLWAKEDVDPWYFQLNEGEGEDITFTITSVTKDAYTETSAAEIKTGKFKLARNKAYKLNIAPNYTPATPAEGSLSLNITIDESTDDKEVEVEIPIDWI